MFQPSTAWTKRVDATPSYPNQEIMEAAAAAKFNSFVPSPHGITLKRVIENRLADHEWAAERSGWLVGQIDLLCTMAVEAAKRGSPLNFKELKDVVPNICIELGLKDRAGIFQLANQMAASVQECIAKHQGRRSQIGAGV